MPIEPAEAKGNEIVRTLATPVLYSVTWRILREQRAGTRELTRCKGEAVIDPTTQWVARKSLVTSVKLHFRDGRTPIPIAQIDPVELAESLYALRLALEGA